MSIFYSLCIIKKWQEFEKMSDDEKWQTFLKNLLRERIKQVSAAVIEHTL